MARSLTFEPRRITPPADPPPVTHTFTHNTTIPVTILLTEKADEAGLHPGSATSVNRPYLALHVDKDSVHAFKIVVSDVLPVWMDWTRVTPHFGTDEKTKYIEDEVEVCIHKVCLWGVANPTLAGSEIALKWDNSAPFSGLTVRDTGGTASRPRVGMSMPIPNWLPCKSPAELLTVDVDASDILVPTGGKLMKAGVLVGTLYLTVGVRISVIS